MSLPTKNFSRHSYKEMVLPNLLAIQRESYEWFWKIGLRNLFHEISPIRDYGEKELELWFEDYHLDEPKYTEYTAGEHNASYEAPLRVRLRLHNKRTGEIKEQEVYLGDVPLMTVRGTFIVNGVERVVVSQLIRSPGVFFTAANWRGLLLYGAKIIPGRGAWLEFETEPEGYISVKIDRRRKVPATMLLRALGYLESDLQGALTKKKTSNKAKDKEAAKAKLAVPNKNMRMQTDEDIRAAFRKIDNNPAVSYIEETLKREQIKGAEEVVVEIYKRIRPGDLATVDNARHLLSNMFLN